MPLNRTTANGIGIAAVFAGGNRIEMEGAKATWATGSFPAGGASEGSESSSN